MEASAVKFHLSQVWERLQTCSQKPLSPGPGVGSCIKSWVLSGIIFFFCKRNKIVYLVISSAGIWTPLTEHELGVLTVTARNWELRFLIQQELVSVVAGDTLMDFWHMYIQGYIVHELGGDYTTPAYGCE